MKNKYVFVIIYSILACGVLYIIENIYSPSYIIIVIQKILLFVIIPIILIKTLKITQNTFWIITKKSFLYGIHFWVIASIGIIWSYFVFQSMIDWGNISQSVWERWITKEIFIFVFAYIMFGNALIEEFFFRWFIFNFINNFSKIFAYLFSWVLFSLYHIAIFWTWFEGVVLWIALLWLFLWWLFFSFLYEKTNGIWAAYIFHIIADLIILIIWYQYLF